jgi:hypothetical protein
MTLFKKSIPRTHPEPLAGMASAPLRITRAGVHKFETALRKGTETDAHRALEEHPELLRDIMPNVGHHGLWFCTKPQIRPPLPNGKKGKIPDLLLAGRGSGGMAWFIVELKGPTDNLFNEDCTAFTRIANKGLNQLAAYLHFAEEKQAHIRDALEIHDFRSPEGILIIGREEETNSNEVKRDMKFFWNNELSSIHIVSFDLILRSARERLKYNS